MIKYKENLMVYICGDNPISIEISIIIYHYVQKKKIDVAEVFVTAQVGVSEFCKTLKRLSQTYEIPLSPVETNIIFRVTKYQTGTQTTQLYVPREIRHKGLVMYPSKLRNSRPRSGGTCLASYLTDLCGHDAVLKEDQIPLSVCFFNALDKHLK